MTPPLKFEKGKKVQNVVGALLRYSRDVDFAMLTALNTIAEQQSKTTERVYRPSLVSLIMQIHIPMPLLDTKQVTRCYMCIVVLPTVVNQKYKSEWVVIFLSQYHHTPPNNIKIQ